MKKTSLIISVIALVMAIALLAIGFCCSNPPTETPSPEPTTPNSSAPLEVPTLNIPSGTYYYILGSHVAHGFEDHKAEATVAILPHFIIEENQYFFKGENADAMGTAHSEDNVIVFTNPQDVQEAMLISVEHDEFWYEIYYPRQEKAWECTYDANTQTITIAHNADFVQFKYFETPEDCAQYLREMYSKDGYIELYPTPERTPVFEDPSEETSPEN